VVDDDTRLRELLKSFLSRSGLRVSTAANAAAARQQLDALDFDLIVLDVMMPGQTGLDFAGELRKTSDVPILMLTAMGDPKDRIAGLEKGVDDYLGKPFEPRELLLRIQSILRRGRPVAASEAPERINFGPFQFPDKLVPVAILAADDGVPVPVYGTGLNVREWTYVDDHADALLAALERGAPGRRYALGSGCGCTNLQLVNAVCRLVRRMKRAGASEAEPIRFVDDRPGHDLRYAIDSAKLRAETGWAPRYRDVRAGLEQTVAWYREHEDWWRAAKEGAEATYQRLGR